MIEHNNVYWSYTSRGGSSLSREAKTLLSLANTNNASGKKPSCSRDKSREIISLKLS